MVSLMKNIANYNKDKHEDYGTGPSSSAKFIDLDTLIKLK
jgi:hypothetical protein